MNNIRSPVLTSNTGNFFSNLETVGFKSSPPHGVVWFVRQLVTCYTSEPNAACVVLTD